MEDEAGHPGTPRCIYCGGKALVYSRECNKVSRIISPTSESISNLGLLGEVLGEGPQQTSYLWYVTSTLAISTTMPQPASKNTYIAP